jgi:hypothetical protein
MASLQNAGKRFIGPRYRGLGQYQLIHADALQRTDTYRRA